MKRAAVIIAAIATLGLIVHCSDDTIIASKSNLTGIYQGTYTLIPRDAYQPPWPGSQVPVVCTFTDNDWVMTIDTSQEVPDGVCLCSSEGSYSVFDNSISLRQVTVFSWYSWCEVSLPCVGHDGLFALTRSTGSDTS